MITMKGKKAAIPAKIVSVMVIVFILSFPVSASMIPVGDVGGGPLVPVGFGDWGTPVVTGAGGSALINLSYDGTDSDEYWEGVWNGAWRGFNFVRHFFEDDICAYAPVSNGHHSFVAQHTQVNGQTGNFYICEYCGKSAGEVLETAYDNYTESLPSQNIYSDGSFLWSPTLSDMYDDDSVGFFCPCGQLPLSGGSGVFYDNYDSPTERFDLTASNTYAKSVHKRQVDGVWVPSGGQWNGIRLIFCFYYPYTGSYSRVRSRECYGYYMDSYYSVKGPFRCGEGELSEKYEISYAYSKSASENSCVFGYPVFRVVLDTPLPISSTESSDTYNIGTRTTSISGDLAYYDTNGDLTLAPNASIVNEGNSTVYNPVTNTTTDMSGWDYDYSTRTYNITYQTTDAETGDTVDNSMTVTYGDENITINDAGTTYNVYYVTQVQSDAPGTDDPGSGSGGNGTGTASGNGGAGGNASVTNNVTIPDEITVNVNTGDTHEHNWVLVDYTEAVTDEDGNILVPSNVTMKCTECGVIEEHEIYPENSVSVKSLRLRLQDFFTDLPGTFSDLTDFLAAGWSYLPNEVLTLIGFAVGAAVLVGIFKLLFR